MAARFDKLNALIQNASRKFLSDIEAWRKANFHELQQLVEQADLEHPEEWLEKLRQWALKTRLWPNEKEPQNRLSRNPMHWQVRAYLWMMRLKAELTHLVHEHCKLIRQQLEVFDELSLRYSSTLPKLVGEAEQLNISLHKLEIRDHQSHNRAIELRQRIEELFIKIAEEMELADKPLDLLMGDSHKKEQTNKIIKLRSDYDDISATFKLIKTYFDWASHEPYITEVIKYLERADATIIHMQRKLRMTGS